MQIIYWFSFLYDDDDESSYYSLNQSERRVCLHAKYIIIRRHLNSSENERMKTFRAQSVICEMRGGRRGVSAADSIHFK